MKRMQTVVDSDHRHYQLPPKPAEISDLEQQHCRAMIKKLLVQHNAVMVAHYYTDPVIQSLAEETGGCVADSLEMARFGHRHSADTLVVAGVRFMGETAKILSPEKRVLMPTLAAECSLDLSCSAAAFSAFCNQHQDRTVVVYANTSAAVKAQADWVVTSSIAVELISVLDSQGKKILWAPDRYLGDYVQRQTGADLLSWRGICIVHDEFKSRALQQMKALYPEAAILAHPEAPQAVLAQADAIGSTSQLITAARQLPQKKLIVATDRGIFYKMQQACPDKLLIAAPTAGEGATCRSCAHCPWMALNGLPAIIKALEQGGREHEIQVEAQLREHALLPINRMLHFAEQLNFKAPGVA